MSWTKLDDGFWMHPKVVLAGNEAAGIFARCLSYSGKYLTDGRIPEQVARLIAGNEQALEHVLETGFLERLSSGDFYVRDYAHYNPLRDEVEAKLEQKRSAGRKGGQARQAKEDPHD